MVDRTGQVAVMFVSQRNAAGDEAYVAAANAMEAAAARQPGFCGIDSARGPDGLGITISWWADEASAIAWREDAAHAIIRERGRAEWYDRYEVAVGVVTRGYSWTRE
jgi:heme-degrading monooxygenase HmoA